MKLYDLSNLVPIIQKQVLFTPFYQFDCEEPEKTMYALPPISLVPHVNNSKPILLSLSTIPSTTASSIVSLLALHHSSAYVIGLNLYPFPNRKCPCKTSYSLFFAVAAFPMYIYNIFLSVSYYSLQKPHKLMLVHTYMSQIFFYTLFQHCVCHLQIKIAVPSQKS